MLWIVPISDGLAPFHIMDRKPSLQWIFMAQGPGIVPVLASLPVALDLAPTILNLMGAPIPEY